VGNTTEPEKQYRTLEILANGLASPRQAGLETGETADLEICATTNVVHPTDLAVTRESVEAPS
jgi:hypothetical protein